MPHGVFNSVRDIPFEELRRLGFKTVIFDKDNTLTDHDSDEISTDIFKRLTQVKDIFGRDNLAIFSNNLKVKDIRHKGSYLQDFEVISQYAVHKKPFSYPEIERLFRDRRGRHIKKEEVIIVGDRLLTDICLANINQMLGLYVLPWDTVNEQPEIKVSRAVENFVWSNMMRNRLRKHSNEEVNKLLHPINNRK